MNINDFIYTDEVMIPYFKGKLKDEVITSVVRNKNGSVVVRFRRGGWLGIDDDLWNKIKDAAIYSKRAVKVGF